MKNLQKKTLINIWCEIIESKILNQKIKPDLTSLLKNNDNVESTMLTNLNNY